MGRSKNECCASTKCTVRHATDYFIFITLYRNIDDIECTHIEIN